MESSKQILSQKQLGRLKDEINQYEWTQELDIFLLDSVLRNYFNFDLVSLELNDEAKRRNLYFGATHSFTNDKCRLRWSYLHMKRLQDKEIKYKQLPVRMSEEQKDDDRPNKTLNLNMHKQQQQKSRNQQLPQSAQTQKNKTSQGIVDSEPKNLLSQKTYDNMTQMKEPKSLGDIEKELWKKNITFHSRQKKDYLDVSNEDFSMNKTVSTDGKEITPSNFNIFRDSLRITSEKLLQTLNDNLPDVNLKDIENEVEDDKDDDEEEEEVLPLDFRTAMIEGENKVVIQAKPLQFKTDEDMMREQQDKQDQKYETTESYLDAVKKEPFKDDNIILIDPDINIKEKFDQIDLACNKENRINNQLNAPLKTVEQIQKEYLIQQQIKLHQKAPVIKKQYDTDTEGDGDEDNTSNQRADSVKSKPDVDFNNILKQWGISDLNKLIGGLSSGSDNEKGKTKRTAKQQDIIEEEEEKEEEIKEPVNERSAKQRVGLIQEIMEENRRAQQARQDQNGQQTSIDMLISSLEDITTEDKTIKKFGITNESIQAQISQTQKPPVDVSEEDSDVAPMSSLVDLPSDEELKKQQQKKTVKAVQFASSASEDESANDKKSNKKVQIKSQSQSDSEQIDTSYKKSKVVTYKGIKIQSDEEGSDKEQKKKQVKSESEQSNSQDSADEYFNQQRKLIKNKILGNKDIQKEFDKEDVASINDQEDYGGERDWDEDMQDFDNMMDQSITEAQKIQEEEARKAQEEQERLRVERLKYQEELIRQEQERKQKERDELMDKLKKQDEERKKRKKEEKDKKEKEREQFRQLEEEKFQREQEEKERQLEIAQRAKAEVDKINREKNESERRKENFEKSIRKIWNGSDVPCLFDSKIAYSKMLYSLPVELEESIRNNTIPYEDLKFRRYKNLIIPLNGLLSLTSGKCMIEIINYFLRYSTIKQIDNNDVSGGSGSMKNTFPFKCIGLVQTVTQPPFSQSSLSAVQPSDPNAYRVLSLMFDTHDAPRTKNNFNDTLKQVKLTSILSQESLQELKPIYASFLNDLAQKYFYANKLKDFPYPVKTDKSPILEFANASDLIFDDQPNSNESLSRIAFFMEYAVQDDVAPISTKESWDFIRRYPTFYAYNSNSKKYTKLDQRGKIVNRFNQFKYENVCVIFKEIQTGVVRDEEYTQQTNCRNSMEYFLKKAIVKEGLEISGMRMIYMDHEQTLLYEQLFNEKLETSSENHTNQGLLALFIRGVESIRKCEGIIGHFNPQTGRATNEKSMRAFFGKDKDHNCVLKMFASQKKNLSELIFWFGGRIQQEIQTQDTNQIVPISTMYLVVPPRIEKQYLFLSPLITTRDLPEVINILCNNYGISVLDIQKINYPKFQYESGSIAQLNKNLCFFKVRGNTYNVEIGYVLKLARENLISKLKIAIPKINTQLAHISRTFGDIICYTQDLKEYKIVKQKLKQTQFNVYLQHYQQEYQKGISKSHTDYDTEDPDNFKEISLFNEQSKILKGVKSKIVQHVSPNHHDSYETQTFLCFLKVSLFSKSSMNEIMSIISRQCGYEIIGSKIIDAKKEIYSELVPKEVRHVFKSMAFKFNEGQPELKLRKKISEFKCLVLVLRGRHVESSLAQVYDKEKLRFIQDIGLYEGSPQVIFLTNQKVLDPLFDFILNAKIIKLYNDFTFSYEHFMDSPIYSYLLNHNVEKLDPVLTQEAESKQAQSLELVNNTDRQIDLNEIMSVQNIVMIKTREHLVESQSTGVNGKLSACVVVIKPNQPFNVALRTLKSIANNQELGLTVQNIEITKYSENQLELLYKHDIEFDENIPDSMKEKLKAQYLELFRNAKNPVIQFLVSGPYAITKMQQLVGNRDPKQAQKDSLRSFYGVDRVDNAYYISENFSESLIERDYLFSNECSTLLQDSIQNRRTIKSLHPTQLLSQTTSQINASLLHSTQDLELALVLIAPTLVLNNEFVFVLEDLIRSKFHLCGLTRLNLEKEDVEALFQDLAPRFYNIEVMNAFEFLKGHSILLVLEKEKAVSEIQEVVGRFEIKNKQDFEKTKKKQSSSVYNMFNYGNDQATLIQEYGSYIYTFPNVALNQKKILRFFKDLPNSQNFVIESQDLQ